MIDLSKRKHDLFMYDLQHENDFADYSVSELIMLLLDPKALANEIMEIIKNQPLKKQQRHDYLKQLIKEDHKHDGNIF